MTTLVKQHKTENYCISMEFRPGYVSGGSYYVEVCPRYNNSHCGYPIRSMVYSMSERKLAMATFNRYKKNYI